MSAPNKRIIQPNPSEFSLRNQFASLRHNLRMSSSDAGFFGAMVGCSENYFAAFAIAVGLGQVTAGLVASLPILCGGIAQLFAFRMLRNNGSYRKWILFCVGMQAFAFLPLIYAAIMGSIPVTLFYLVVSLYWAGGMASSPAWNAWLSQLLPGKIRPRYFAKRTRLTQFATLMAFLGGGAILHLAGGREHSLGFVVLFAVALIARFASAFSLSAHQTTIRVDTASIEATSWKNAWNSLSPDVRKLIIYLVLLTAAIQMSGPFFAPYMLVQLNFEYPQFVAIVAMAMLTRIISLSFWGKYTQEHGTRYLLWTAGICMIPLAPLWIVSTNFWWILSIQALAGVVWAGYELATLLIFFEYVPLARKAQIVTLYNFFNALAWFVGAAIGGYLISWFGRTPNAYYVVFGLTALGRFGFFVWAWSSIHWGTLRERFIDLRTEVAGFRNTPAAPLEIRSALITSVDVADQNENDNCQESTATNQHL